MPKSQFYVYIAILLLPFLLIIYQGCKSTTLTSTSVLSGDHSNSRETPDPTPIIPITYDRGYIVQINPLTGDVIEDDLLSTNSNVTFKFMNAHPDSNNYKWTIKRGFESIITNASTDVDTYQTSFTQQGAYDVFVESYDSSETDSSETDSSGTFLNAATKRFVVGESCQLTDILEIELLSGSLKVDSSATFALKDSDDFSDIQWKATLPSSGNTVEETSETFELSFESEGTLIIEVSAVSSDPLKNECLTYRSKKVNITSSLSPYFNLITLTDGTDEIATLLENNDIYKYERPTSQYLQVEVLHAHTCEYQVDDESDKTEFTCNDGLIDISLNADPSCVEKTIHLFAADETKSQKVSQTYYNYCPDSNYCYMGPTDKKQSHHACQEDDSTKTDDAVNGSCDNSIRNGCTSGTNNDSIISDTDTYYRWHCEGSNGGSTATGCQKEIVQGVVDGVCDNSTRNSCLYGTADDSALEDTDTHYRWQCIGSGGGLTAPCQKEKTQ